MLVHNEDTRVAEFEIEPKTEGEAHYHTSVSEYCVCSRGQFQVKTSGSSAHSFRPGERTKIQAGVTHQIINTGTVPCRYLVVQYGGAYDFVTV